MLAIDSPVLGEIFSCVTVLLNRVIPTLPSAARPRKMSDAIAANTIAIFIIFRWFILFTPYIEFGLSLDTVGKINI
jgi:hypothetical protein